MTADNPFAEPGDSDRTVIRPAPGGRRPASEVGSDTMASAQWRSAEDAGSGGEAALPAVGASPLLAAAAPLLQLLARLRNTLSQPNADELRTRAADGLHAFDHAARKLAIPMDQLRPAHYALCASLDDLVLNTPWGSQGTWASRSLVSTFHQEVRSGERFFDILAQVKQSVGAMLPVLELMYLCLALGFQGRYRLSARGPAELDRLREEAYALIRRHRPTPSPELSPHWAGAAAPYRPAQARLPVWVAAAAGLACVAAAFAWFSFDLNDVSDALYERALASPPAQMPPLARAAPVQPPTPGPPPATPAALDRLRSFLRPEIEQRLVTVVGTDAVPVVRIAGRGVFASGAAMVQPQFAPLLARIAAALNRERGPVDVVGYTDDQPIRTLAFPSNLRLSTARAAAAAAVVAGSMDDPARLATEGRADADPIASNATPDGRERNRRIEIVLHRLT